MKLSYTSRMTQAKCLFLTWWNRVQTGKQVQFESPLPNAFSWASKGDRQLENLWSPDTDTTESGGPKGESPTTTTWYEQ